MPTHPPHLLHLTRTPPPMEAELLTSPAFSIPVSRSGLLIPSLDAMMRMEFGLLRGMLFWRSLSVVMVGYSLRKVSISCSVHPLGLIIQCYL